MWSNHGDSSRTVENPLADMKIVKYVGDRYLNKRNTALAPGFTTVDIGGGYRFDRYELRLDGRNLGDARDPVSEANSGMRSAVE